jgi:hypothetical protein
MRLVQVRFLLLGISCVATLYSAPVGVDGLLGSEWSGVTPVHVPVGPSACNTCFQNPKPETNGPEYDIYVRGDADYYYALVLAAGPSPGVFGANLYFDLNPSAADGSDFGMEVTNNRAFIPGVPGYTDLTGYLTFATNPNPAGIELSLPWSFFLTDPRGMQYPTLPDSKITMRISQTFSYAVVGGSTFGTDRLGSVTYNAEVVPEPATTGLMGLCLAGLIGVNSTLRGRISRAFSRR